MAHLESGEGARMTKKRELTVEKWLHDMNRNREWAKADPTEYFGRQLKRGIRLEDIVYEFQMSKYWELHGMQVYEFDPDFTNSILDERWSELLPEVIDYAPHDCFYMKLPHNKDSEGVVICIVPVENIPNFDEKHFPGALENAGVHVGGREGYDKRVLVNTGERVLSLCSYAIPREHEHMLDDYELGEYPAELIANGVAYLCSTNADIAAVYSPKKEKRKNNGKKRSQATWHEVGYRIGAELRNYMRTVSERSEKTGRTVRPHMRRAHWHRYWIGPRDGERRLVLKWVAPTMVGIGIESATGHKVR